MLEKESEPGAHASGRNSGVLHAGFYYSADSLKAQFSRDGNARFSAYCEEHDLPIRRCGKLVVARTERDHAGLDELLRRATVNGVELTAITEQEAKEIEPRAKTAGRALWSPTTSVVNPRAIMRHLASRARALGVSICTGKAWRSRRGRFITTSSGSIESGYFVNAAGVYADAIARAYGFAERYRMLPFKGLYLYGDSHAGQLACCIYPVPDLGMPFLGVHFTVTLDGGLKIGPTAMPALWLEQYGEESVLSRFSAGEFGAVARGLSGMMLSNGSIRRLAVREVRKMSRDYLVRDASSLLRDVHTRHFRGWGRPGIRAQLYDSTRRELVMDFCVEHDDRSMHVLNAVSPAFTCAFPFASHVVDRILAPNQIG